MKKEVIMAEISKYRITSAELMRTIHNWEQLINFKVNLIGCGGTALTLLEIKESTKDIDFIVPIEKEHKKLMKFLSSIGYEEKGGGLAHPEDPFCLYQFWAGDRVFTTDLLESPLKSDNNITIKKWRHIYLGVLNLYDLIITKMFRGISVDIDDCVSAFITSDLDPERLLKRYSEAAKYDLNPEKMMLNFTAFAEALLEKNAVDQDFIEKVMENR
jgi:hypothetical protein